MIDDFMKRMMQIASIGMDENGVSRVFGSKSMEEASQALMEYMRESGLEVYQDSVGNVHGIYFGKGYARQGCTDKSIGNENAEKESDGKPQEIILASHLDTVKNGGIYDGLLGVMAGIECVRRLRDTGKRLGCSIHVIATNGEEGNALGGTFGSRAMTGMLPLEDDAFLLRARDFGYSREALSQASYDLSRCICYLELHIEQGNTLEEEKKSLGIVSGIVWLRRYDIYFSGRSNHAGTTMMQYRKDALVEAARFIAYADSCAKEIGKRLVCTFSRVEVQPNVLAVINNRVSMVMECRNQDTAIMDAFAERMREKIKEIPGAFMESSVEKKPAICDRRIVSVMKEVFSEKKINGMLMPSGATHDANCFSEKVPVGMLFVPSKAGLSHCKEEYSSPEDIERSLDVLYAVLLRIAEKGLQETEFDVCA